MNIIKTISSRHGRNEFEINLLHVLHVFQPDPELIIVLVSVVDYFYVSSIIAYLSQESKLIMKKNRI